MKQADIDDVGLMFNKYLTHPLERRSLGVPVINT
jgi:hypothetical protein